MELSNPRVDAEEIAAMGATTVLVFLFFGFTVNVTDVFRQPQRDDGGCESEAAALGRFAVAVFPEPLGPWVLPPAPLSSQILE